MLDPRAADHDVDVEVCEGVHVRQVGDDSQDPDLGSDALGGFGVTVKDGHIGTGSGERDRDPPADPGGPTGHKCTSSGQWPRIILLGF